LFIFFILGKPQKSFDDLFGETNSKKLVMSDDDDDYNMSADSDESFVPKSSILIYFDLYCLFSLTTIITILLGLSDNLIPSIVLKQTKILFNIK
jgi:hypothetical protein